MNEARRDAVVETLRRINEAWVHGRLDDLAASIHPDIVLAPPGFSERERGRESFLAGHRDFYQAATIHEFKDHDYQVDVVGDSAVATFRYELVYEHYGQKYVSTGRDLWVFDCRGGNCVAVWRTILEVEESAV